MPLFDYTLEQLQKLLDDVLSIDDSSGYLLDESIKNHAKLHAKWAFLAARAKKLASIAEMEFESTVASLSARVRDEAERAGKPFPKSAPVSKEVVPTLPEWKEAYRKMLDMKEYADVLTSIDWAFNNRARLLDVLGRRKMFTEPGVRQQPRRERAEIVDELVEMRFPE